LGDTAPWSKVKVGIGGIAAVPAFARIVVRDEHNRAVGFARANERGSFKLSVPARQNDALTVTVSFPKEKGYAKNSYAFKMVVPTVSGAQKDKAVATLRPGKNRLMKIYSPYVEQ